MIGEVITSTVPFAYDLLAITSGDADSTRPVLLTPQAPGEAPHAGYPLYG